MSQSLAVLSHESTFVRHDKEGNVKTQKIGGVAVIVQRGVSGVAVSGSKAERYALASAAFGTAYVNGQFKTVAVDIRRVFGALVNTLADGIGLSLESGKVASETITNRQAWEMIFQSIDKANTAKPFKGEKATYAAIINDARAMLAAKIKQDADAAELARLAKVADSIDAPTTEVQAPALSLDATVMLADAFTATGSNERVNADAELTESV